MGILNNNAYLITEWAEFNEIAVHRFLGKSYAM